MCLYWTAGTGSREDIHDLGFDCSYGFHEYEIKRFPTVIVWLIDGKTIRRVEKESGTNFPEKLMY